MPKTKTNKQTKTNKKLTQKWSSPTKRPNCRYDFVAFT